MIVLAALLGFWGLSLAMVVGLLSALPRREPVLLYGVPTLPTRG